MLSEVPEELAALIQAEPLFEQPLFDPWINEPAAAATKDIWYECMAQAQRADIPIAIYSGDAGWANEGGEVGNCHAELETPEQRRRQSQSSADRTIGDTRQRTRSQTRSVVPRVYVASEAVTGTPCKTGEELIALCRITLREAVAQISRLGVREASKGKFYTGEALDGTRLDFRAPQQKIETILTETLMLRYKGERLRFIGPVSCEDRPGITFFALYSHRWEPRRSSADHGNPKLHNELRQRFGNSHLGLRISRLELKPV